ncbi:MAG TPA: ATP-binding protein [Bryobacteraceae bacterium]|nr:ATP-binding protein [Bryobacteraceae bacterium]
MAGVPRTMILHGRTHVPAPFVFFYPAIALAAFLGGAGPGLAAGGFAVAFTLLFLPGFPAPANWIWLCILGPLIVFSFSRLKRLRDRNAALALESQNLHFVVDRASDWIFLSDGQGVIQYANRTAAAQIGATAEELTGRPLRDFISEPDRAVFDDLLRRCSEKSAPPAEILFERLDRSVVTVEVGCTATSAGGAPLFHIAGRDVTERKAIDRKLREARQWESLGALAGGIAHDFNNLLTSIMGNASLARESLAEGHPAVELLASIEAAGERSAELIRMMLATSGYKPRYRESLRVDNILAGLLGARALSSNVTIRAATDAAEFESDVRSVEMLLWSLISNAAESYGDAGGEVGVSIRSVDAAQAAHATLRTDPDFEDGALPAFPCVGIKVRDAGSGMTPEVLDRAFDPFFTTRFTGRGLGLPAVRGIVRAHGGRIEVRTKPGEGTCIEVWLPSAAQHAEGIG